VVAHHARPEIDEDRFAPYKVIGELGSRPLPVYVARHATAGIAGSPVVVVERFVGAGDEAGADFRREARRLSTLANQHILRVREVVVRGQDLLVFGDFIEGEKLGSLWRFDGEAPATSGARAKPGERLPLEITLRWLLDVLTGLSALHALRDARQQPMKLMHGEISAATILVGLDGVGRILHAVARRAPDVRAEPASFDYLAPEIHANASRDGRADVFSVGVLLWEALSGTRLSASCDGPAGLRVSAGPIAAPLIPEAAPWARGLAPVVAKALAYAPEDRWQTAAAMAAEIRKAAGLKLAPASAATAYAKNKFGDRVKVRRARLESLGGSVPALPAASVATPPPIPAALLGAAAPAIADGAGSVRPGIAAASEAKAPSPVAPPLELPLAPALDSHWPPDLPPAVPADLSPLAPPPIGPLAPDGVRPASEAPIAAEIPTVIDEPFPFDDLEAPSVADHPPLAPVAAPLALSAMEEYPSPRPRRRRHIIFGSVALGIAVVSMFALRSLHRRAAPSAQPDVLALPAPATTPVDPVPAIASAPSPAPSAPPPSASATPDRTAPPHDGPLRKPGTKGKTPVAPPHTKSTPARTTVRAKPGSS
jgi:serine/threonine protein kinase